MSVHELDDLTDEERATAAEIAAAWLASNSDYRSPVSVLGIASTLAKALLTATTERDIARARGEQYLGGMELAESALAAMCDALDAKRAQLVEVADKLRVVTVERDEAIESARAADERMAGVLDGTFSVGDRTATKEIERLRTLLPTEAERCCLAAIPRGLLADRPLALTCLNRLSDTPAVKEPT